MLRGHAAAYCGGDCAADQYCQEDDFFDEGKCVPKDPGCTSAADCATGQECKSGLCVAKVESPATCEWQPNMTDGCAEVEVCVGDESGTTNKCYPMPACGEGYTCPTGTTGALCNNDGNAKILTAKADICLLGLCKTNDNCPGEYTCDTSLTGGLPFGYCLPAGMGGCEDDTDCPDGEVCDDFSGMCMPDMGF